MTILIAIIVGVVVIGGATMLIIAGLRATRSKDESDPLMARLEEATQRGDVISSLEQIEMQQPFSQRVIVPLLQRIGEMSTSITPQKVYRTPRQSLKLQEIQAGSMLPPF